MNKTRTSEPTRTLEEARELAKKANVPSLDEIAKRLGKFSETEVLGKVKPTKGDSQ